MTTALLQTLTSLATAPIFTVRRIDNETAEAFCNMPEYNGRYALIGNLQVRLDRKLNGVPVLVRLN